MIEDINNNIFQDIVLMKEQSGPDCNYKMVHNNYYIFRESNKAFAPTSVGELDRLDWPIADTDYLLVGFLRRFTQFTWNGARFE